MREILNIKLTTEEAQQYFADYLETNSEYRINCKYIQRFGKKTVEGIHIMFVNHQQHDGYATETYSSSTPSVRIPLSTPMPASRKSFAKILMTSVEAWLNSTQVSKDHPYYKVANSLYVQLTKQEAA